MPQLSLSAGVAGVELHREARPSSAARPRETSAGRVCRLGPGKICQAYVIVILTAVVAMTVGACPAAAASAGEGAVSPVVLMT